MEDRKIMESFAVRIQIDTRLSLRGLLHLDGLLGALAVARGREATDIPLQKHEGIWQGSAAILETGPFGALAATQVRIKHLVAERVPDGILEHLRPAERRIGEMNPMRNALSAYPCFDGIRAVWFTGCGISAAVMDLLSDARNLGAMGRTGYGRVIDLELVDIEQRAMAGIVLSSNLPARTVPVEIWNRLDLGQPRAAVISLQRFQPPYWTGPEVACISPMQVDLTGNFGDIRAIVGTS
jgi:hypothetical protein